MRFLKTFLRFKKIMCIQCGHFSKQQLRIRWCYKIDGRKSVDLYWMILEDRLMILEELYSFGELI